MKELEIGQRVKWYIGTFYCCGIYRDKIDETTSSVQMYERNGQRYICKVEVLTDLLELIPETAE